MINALYWLVYLISAAIAFALVHAQAWRLVPAMLVGTAAGILLSLPVMFATPREHANPWFQVELAMNGSLSLILAGAGAAIAYALRERRE